MTPDIVSLAMLAWIIVTAPASSAFAQPIILAGIDYPPYSIQHKDSLDGLAVKIAREIAKRSGTEIKEINISIDRFKELSLSDATLFPVIIRIPDRESQFQWIGEIEDDHYCFATLKSAPVIANIDVAKKLGHIGVIRGGATLKTASELGLENLEIAMDISGNARKLLAKKLDAWFTQSRVFGYGITEVGGEPTAIRCDGDFGTVSNWIAASLKVPQAKLKAWVAAYKSMVKDGTLAKMIRQ